ncbi:unnamed protein product [Closterium sp. NIES-65]|nr:unnamed protein product [Closterium sp. NIES-65]
MRALPLLPLLPTSSLHSPPSTFRAPLCHLPLHPCPSIRPSSLSSSLHLSFICTPLSLLALLFPNPSSPPSHPPSPVVFFIAIRVSVRGNETHWTIPPFLTDNFPSSSLRFAPLPCVSPFFPCVSPFSPLLFSPPSAPPFVSPLLLLFPAFPPLCPAFPPLPPAFPHLLPFLSPLLPCLSPVFPKFPPSLSSPLSLFPFFPVSLSAFTPPCLLAHSRCTHSSLPHFPLTHSPCSLSPLSLSPISRFPSSSPPCSRFPRSCYPSQAPSPPTPLLVPRRPLTLRARPLGVQGSGPSALLHAGLDVKTRGEARRAVCCGVCVSLVGL